MHENRAAVPSGMFRALLSGAVALLLVPPAATAESLQDEMRVVERIRGLEFAHPVAQKTLPREQLRKHLIGQLQKELPIGIEQYFRVLDALELIEKNTDTLEVLLSLYEAQVLAFYDPSTHVYYSLESSPRGIELNEAITATVAVHELTHALQDQLFDAGDRLSAMRGNSDAQMAYHAVLEGEAMLVMAAALFEQLGQNLDAIVKDDTFLGSLAALAELSPGVPTDAPAYFVESMKFPYLEGLRFVIAAYRRGGWAAVDELHKDPPVSTEQVLHPETFFARQTASTPRPVRPAERKALLKETVGEFTWKFLLGEKAAGGWGGDSVQVVDGSDSMTVFVQSEWDTEQDAEEFARTYRQFLQSRSIDPKLDRQGRRVSVTYCSQ